MSAPDIERLSDIERRERTVCALVGLPYDSIVPGSMTEDEVSGGWRFTVLLKAAIEYVTLSGTVEV